MEQKESHNVTRIFNTLLLPGTAILCILLFGVFASRLHTYTMDDSFMIYRYASNLASGHGLTFNPGEYPRAEGITSPLYAVLLAPVAHFGLGLETCSKVMGLGACILAVLFAAMALYLLIGETTELTSWNALLLPVLLAGWLLSNPYLIGNSVSGMETAFGALSVSVFLFMLIRQQTAAGITNINVAWLGGAAVLVPMFRPEMGLFVIVMFGGIFVLCKGGRAPLIKSFVVFLLLGILYYGLRYAYYGLPLPLPFYIKQGTGGLPGRVNMEAYLKTGALLIPLVCLAVSFALGAGLSMKRIGASCLLSMAVATVVQFAYYCTVVPVMGFGFRFFIPITMVFAALAFAGFAIVYDLSLRSNWSRQFSVPCMAFFVFLLLVGSNVFSYSGARDLFLGYAAGMPRYAEIGRSLRKASDGANLQIAINDCGVIPYESGLKTLDLAGLNNRAIALSNSADTTRSEMRKARPDLVFLLSTRLHDMDALLGWEKLTSADMTALSYEYAGAINIASERNAPPDDCPNLAVYTLAQSASKTAPVLDRLVASGMVETP